MKYKVGDKVKVREDLEVGKEYNDCTFIIDMEKYKGKTATIIYCYEDSYDIDIDDGNWFWTDDMLEDVVESESKDEKTVDIGYYLEYCGHRVIEDAIFDGFDEDKAEPHMCFTKNGIPCTLPVNAIDWVIPHED